MNKEVRFNERLRLFFQAVSFAFHNGYLKGWSEGKIYSGSNKKFCLPGLNCYSCPGAIGACPIGSLQAVLDSGSQKYSLYVLGFIGVMGVFFGRLICGWMCPFGFVQDLLYRIPLFKKIKNLPGHDKLRYLRFFILAVFVVILPMSVVNRIGVGSPWFCEYICPSGMLFGGIPLVIANPELRGAIGFRFIFKLLILIAVILLSIKSYRPFCKYVCPLGALYGCGNKVSVYRLKVDENKCVKCGSCQNICGMDIRVWENPNSLDCIRCGKCKAVCPTGAITSTLDDVINITGLSKKTRKEVSEINSSDRKNLKVYVFISALLLIVSGIVIFFYTKGLAFDGVLNHGYMEQRDKFINNILTYCNSMLPAMFNVVFGIKLIADYFKNKSEEKLLECCSMASKFFFLPIIFLIITSLFFTVSSTVTTDFTSALLGLKAMYITYYGVYSLVASVIAYFVLKFGIKKTK